MKSFYKSFRESIDSRLRLHFRNKEHSEEIAYAMGQMLKLPLQQARDLAAIGAAQRKQINSLPQAKDLNRALEALRNMQVPLDVPQALVALQKHASSSYLLALPFTVSAMSLLAHLVSDTRRRFCIVDTRLTRYYFYPFVKAPETRERVQLIAPAAMLRHNRSRVEMSPADNAVTYVTFPDLESTSLDTARRIAFLGEDYQFSTLEPLLFFRGLAPLFTFDAAEFAATGRLKLISCPLVDLRCIREDDVDALLVWLAGCVEQVFREVPAEVLSWAETHMLAYNMKAITAVMKLKMVEGYLRAWKVADQSLAEAPFRHSMAELQKAQETIDKQRVAAIVNA
jgi:hypothetical protein